MSETVEIERDMDFIDGSFINLLLLFIYFTFLSIGSFGLFWPLFAVLLAFLAFFGFPSLLDEVSGLRLKEIRIAIM